MKKKIYEILRKCVAKQAIGNLGKIEILEDEIRCYVNGKKLKQKSISKYGFYYDLKFKTILSPKEIHIAYNLNKSVHYIIRDIDFDRGIKITAPTEKCHVTFETCTFTGGIRIENIDHITFIDNEYKEGKLGVRAYSGLLTENTLCITTSNIDNINKIEFICDEISIAKTASIKKIWLQAKNIELSNVDILDARNIDIEAENLLIEDSNISSKEIEINVDNVVLDNTEIKVDTILFEANKIENKETDIIHKSLFVNGIEVTKNEDINIETLESSQKRLELKNSSSKIEVTSKEELKKSPLTKVLKKNK